MNEPAGQSPAVVVVGAINVDLVVLADELPRAGQTVVGCGPTQHGGGKGANAAVAAARAGAAVRLVGAVGRDAMAKVALADLREAGVDLSGVAHLERETTGVALIVVDRAGENLIAVGAGANGRVDQGWVNGRLTTLLAAQSGAGAAGCVLVSTEIPGDAVTAAVAAAARSGVMCVLNTAPPTPVVAGLLDQAPLLTPNALELERLSKLLGAPAPPDDPSAQAVDLARRTGRPVVVTLGAAGVMIADPDGAIQAIAAPPVRVVDTTGAGDTFNGVLAARLAAGDRLPGAVSTAVTAASLSVSRLGARGGMPTAQELERARLERIRPAFEDPGRRRRP